MNEHAQPSAAPISKQRLRLWLRLLRAHRIIEARLREELRRGHASTLPRFDVLAALDRYRDGLRMSELSQKLRVSNGNVTNIVERLVSEGLIERVKVAGDRRAMRVRLTPKGTARFAGIAAEHEVWVDGLLARLGPEEVETAIAVLDKIGEEEEE